jgi:hypothetical protein
MFRTLNFFLPYFTTFAISYNIYMARFSLTIVLFLFGCAAYAQHNVVPATDGFVVKGSVKNELRFTLKDLQRFNQSALGDIAIKNKKGEQKGEIKNVKGVLLKTVLDSAHIYTEKPKELSELCILLIASDKYKNVYSWNEIFNTEIGNHIFIITEKDGKPIDMMDDRILVMSLSDLNSGSRHLKGLAVIEVKKVQ